MTGTFSRDRERWDVIIAEAHPLVATHLQNVVSNLPCVATCRVQYSPQFEEPRRPTLCLVDNKGLDLAAVEYLKKAIAGTNTQHPLKFIVLDHQCDFYKICQLVAQGADGFLTYDKVSDSLSLAIRSVARGGVWLDSCFLHRYMGLHQREKEAKAASDNLLTVREEEILHCARQRMSNKEIAASLNIEVSTVKFHLSHVFAKLRIANKADLWDTPLRAVTSWKPSPSLPGDREWAQAV